MLLLEILASTRVIRLLYKRAYHCNLSDTATLNYPSGFYLFLVNKGNIGGICKICSKFAIKTPGRCLQVIEKKIIKAWWWSPFLVKLLTSSRNFTEIVYHHWYIPRSQKIISSSRYVYLTVIVVLVKYFSWYKSFFHNHHGAEVSVILTECN